MSGPNKIDKQDIWTQENEPELQEGGVGEGRAGVQSGRVFKVLERKKACSFGPGFHSTYAGS